MKQEYEWWYRIGVTVAFVVLLSLLLWGASWAGS